MKTSNYILIVFFMMLFGGILVLFMKSKTVYKALMPSQFETQEMPLNDFSVIIAERGAHFYINSGDTSKIVLKYAKGQKYSMPSFTVRNDTLFISSNPKNNGFWPASIVCKNLNSIEGKENSRINVEKFHSDSLFVKLYKASFQYYEKTDTNYFSLKLISDNSTTFFENGSIIKADIQLQESHLTFSNTNISDLSAKIRKNSQLSGNRICNLKLDADCTSSYERGYFITEK